MEEMYLIFLSDSKRFSLPFKYVGLITTGEEPAAIPDFPDYVMGTIVNDKKAVAVINLRKRFNYEPKSLSDRDCIIITAGERRVGLLCDSIEGFVSVEQDKILPPPSLDEESAARFITGEFLTEENEICYILSPALIIKPEDEEKVFNE